MKKDYKIAVAGTGARDIIRGCHNRDKGTAENERLRNPKFIFSYPTGVRALMYRPSHRPSLRLCMFSPRRAISVSSCSLDTHLTTYFVYLRPQLDFSWRTEQFAKSFGFCEVFSKAGWDHSYGFLLNSRYNHDKIIGECRQYYLKLVSSIFHVEDTFLLSQFSKIVPIKTAYLRYAVCGCCLTKIQS